MHILRYGLAFAALGFTAAVDAQRNPRTNVEFRGTVRPAPDSGAGSMRSRDPNFRALTMEEARRLTSYSYGTVLRFAECVARFDPAAAPRVLHSRLASDGSTHTLTRMASVNRGCVVQHSNVHPLLLRAALAETWLKHAGEGARDRSVGHNPVGVPAIVDGYPLRTIASCQVKHAPQLVGRLLATQPGGAAERQAAEALFGETAECGASRLGRLAPTAARLALVEAEYTRRFVAP